MFVGAFLQAPALLGAGIWVHCDMIGGLRVQSSSGEFVPSVGCVPFHTGVDNGSF